MTTIECPGCSGERFVELLTIDLQGEEGSEYSKCPQCNGTGRAPVKSFDLGPTPVVRVTDHGEAVTLFVDDVAIHCLSLRSLDRLLQDAVAESDVVRTKRAEAEDPDVVATLHRCPQCHHHRTQHWCKNCQKLERDAEEERRRIEDPYRWGA